MTFLSPARALKNIRPICVKFSPGCRTTGSNLIQTSVCSAPPPWNSSVILLISMSKPSVTSLNPPPNVSYDNSLVLSISTTGLSLDVPRILHPLHALGSAPVKKNDPLPWNPPANTAFATIKDALLDASLLCHPQPAAPTSIITDASNIAVGAVLQQYINSVWSPIAYFSWKLRPPETKYSTFDRELLAIYLTIKHFQHFVEGRDFPYHYRP